MKYSKHQTIYPNLQYTNTTVVKNILKDVVYLTIHPLHCIGVLLECNKLTIFDEKWMIKQMLSSKTLYVTCTCLCQTLTKLYKLTPSSYLGMYMQVFKWKSICYIMLYALNPHTNNIGASSQYTFVNVKSSPSKQSISYSSRWFSLQDHYINDIIS